MYVGEDNRFRFAEALFGIFSNAAMQSVTNEK